MKKGQEITFNNLNSPIQLKQLNDVINHILTALSERLNVDSLYMQYICSKTVTCSTPGQWYDIEFDKAYCEEPIIIAYSPDGAQTAVRKKPDDANMYSRAQVSFADTEKTGSIYTVAIGRILLK